MALINAYNFKLHNNITRYTYDLVGSANGYATGINRPDVSSNGITFLGGGHGTIAGDWGRMEFPIETFLHTAEEDFSILIVFNSTKADLQYHSIFHIGDVAVHSKRINISLNADENENFSINAFNGVISNNANLAKYNQVCITNTTGLCTVFSNGTKYINTNNAITGVMYDPNSKVTIGGMYKANTNNYAYDYKGSVLSFLHFNHKLSNAEISQYNNQLQGII